MSTPAPPAPPRRSRRDAARDEWLAAVERLLGEGELYGDISVERLAAEVGASRTRFYHYFEDRNDLLKLWFRRTEQEIVEAAAGWWELGAEATLDDLRRVVGELVPAYRRRAPLMEAVFGAGAADVELRTAFASMMERFIQQLRAHIERGQHEDWIDGSLLPGETAAWLAWMSERGARRAPAPGTAEMERFVDAYAHWMWRVLYLPTRR